MKRPAPITVFFIAAAAVALVAGGLPVAVNALAPVTNQIFASEAEEQTAMNALDLQIRERLIAAYPDADWPATLDYVGGRVSTPDGLLLAELPAGTALEYTREFEPKCHSGGIFDLELVGPDFGAVPERDSITWGATDWTVWGTDASLNFEEDDGTACVMLEVETSD